MSLHSPLGKDYSRNEGWLPPLLHGDCLQCSCVGVHTERLAVQTQPGAFARAAPPPWMAFPTHLCLCLGCPSGLSSISSPLRNLPQLSSKVGQVPLLDSLSSTVSPHESLCSVPSGSPGALEMACSLRAGASLLSLCLQDRGTEQCLTDTCEECVCESVCVCVCICMSVCECVCV